MIKIQFLKYLIPVVLMFTVGSHAAFAQAKKTYFQDNNYIDVAAGAGKNIFTGSVSGYHLHQLGKRKKFNIGYGIRLTSAFGTNQDHITAPAKLTSKQQGPQVLFSKTYNENLDTLRIATVQANSVNLTINIQYNFLSKLSFGANIDAFGFSFGKKTSDLYQSSISSDNNTQQTAKPTTINALLVSDNDYGTLNSEFYLAYSISKKISLRAGYEFLFTEYTTTKKLALDNDRYRAKYRMAFIGLSYRLMKK